MPTLKRFCIDAILLELSCAECFEYETCNAPLGRPFLVSEVVIHALNMFINTFLLKIYPKGSKKLKSTSICSDDHGGFVTPYDHCAVGHFSNKICSNVYNIKELDFL